jgi:hypothetical protein
MVAHQDQFRMPARDQQRQQRELRGRRGLRHICRVDPGRVDVTFQVVHPHQRAAGSQGQPFGSVHTHDQRTSQPGTARHGDDVHVSQREVGLVQGLLDDGIDRAYMLARGNFREDAAIGSVQLDLCGDHTGQQGAPVFDHSGCRLIAGGLDTQHARGRKHGKDQIIRHAFFIPYNPF